MTTQRMLWTGQHKKSGRRHGFGEIGAATGLSLCLKALASTCNRFELLDVLAFGSAVSDCQTCVQKLAISSASSLHIVN